MDQKSKNNKSQKSIRPPSVGSKKGKNIKSVLNPTSVNSQTQKSKDKRPLTPLRTEKSSVKDTSKISKKEKSIKINSSVNTMNDKEDVSLIDLIQEKGNSIVESKKERNFNQSFKKQDNFDAKVHLNYGSEIKITPNITTINKLINNSQDVLNEQRNILENITELNKRLVSSELELQRHASKAENDDFNNQADKFLCNVNEVIEKLKSHSEEMENIKFIKEENKNLKYKLELMNIDQKDLTLGVEAKLTSQKNFLTNELNTLNDLLCDLGFEAVSPKLKTAEFDEDSISLYFQNLKKLFRNVKIKFSENENRINCLNVDKQSLEEEIKFFKVKVENIHKKTIQSDPNLQVLIKQQYEEELNHYKNQVKQLQMQIQENNNNKNKEIPNDNKNNFSYNKHPSTQYQSKFNNVDHDGPGFLRNGYLGNNYNSNNMNSYENKNYEKYFERKTYDDNNNNINNDFPEGNIDIRNNKNVYSEFRNYSENRNYRSNNFDPKNDNTYDNNNNKNLAQRYANNNRDIQFGSYEDLNSNKVRSNNTNYNELSHNYDEISNANYFSSQNNTLDNFRRIKDTRTSTFNQTNDLSNNPNSTVFNSNEIKLENKYSDSNFYKPDNTLFNSNNYDYSNNYNQ